jgi:hypothetical protein
MKFSRSIVGKTKSDRIINEIIREVGIKKLLPELEEKLLQWFRHVKRVKRTRILRRELELKCKGKRRRWFRQVLENITKRGKKWQKTEKERLGR